MDIRGDPGMGGLVTANFGLSEKNHLVNKIKQLCW